MTDYNKGWWSCFISFCIELKPLTDELDDKTCKLVLEGAGVTPKEIQEVLDNETELLSYHQETKEYLEVTMMEMYSKEEMENEQ